MLDILVDAIVFKALGGLGIFLLGMKFMSEGMQAVAGKRLQKLIGAVTNNRLMACGVGTLVTCVIQSSSVTTVMVIGFVNGGFMTLMQAMGVILGANIGTTITGWILALKIGKYGLPIIGIASFVYLFSKNERLRFGAMSIVGIGMVFFGLETMASGFKNPEVKDVLETVFATMSGATYIGVLKCALVGCIATMIVQSSSATLGITIALAQSGVIQFETAAGLVLGLNIGTTITAFLASLGASTNAKRAAYAHIIFNVAGTIWLYPVFFIYCDAVESIAQMVGADLTAKIALTHTGFNLINTVLFLPLMPLLAKLVTMLVPEKTHTETPHLTFLDIRMLDTPAIAIQQSYDEILRMASHTEKMLGYLMTSLKSDAGEPESERKLFHREEILDVVQKEVTEFVSNMLSGNVSHDVVDAGRMHLRLADEYESISDYIAAILKLRLKLRNEDIALSREGDEELAALHNSVTDYLIMVNDALRDDNPSVLSKAHTQGDSITHQMKEARESHLGRVASQHVSPLNSLVFTDMLTAYRRIKDHVLNVAEVIAGEK